MPFLFDVFAQASADAPGGIAGTLTGIAAIITAFGLVIGTLYSRSKKDPAVPAVAAGPDDRSPFEDAREHITFLRESITERDREIMRLRERIGELDEQIRDAELDKRRMLLQIGQLEAQRAELRRQLEEVLGGPR